MRSKNTRFAMYVALAVVVVFAFALALAAAAPLKGAKCPANPTQLTGCIKAFQMKAGTMTLDCNGVKHQVVMAKNAKIMIDNMPAKMADLKKLQTGSATITVQGKCGKGTTFMADKITASTKPLKPKAA